MGSSGGDLLLSTAPPWITESVDGGDGGPLDGVSQEWRDHWKQCWAPLIPTAAAGGGGGRLVVDPGSLVGLRVAHDAISISVGLVTATSPAATTLLTEHRQSRSAGESDSGDQDDDLKGAVQVGDDGPTLSSPASASPLPALVSWNSPMRIWQLGDLPGRWGPLCASVIHHLGPLMRAARGSLLMPLEQPNQAESRAAPSAALGSPEGKNAVLMDIVTLGDGPVLPLMVAASCASFMDVAALGSVRKGAALGCSDKTCQKPLVRITAAQGSGASLSSQWATRVALKKDHGGESCSLCFEQWHCYSERLKASGCLSTRSAAVPGHPPLLIVAEPYYRDLEGQLPWYYSLRFWSQLQTIR